MSGKNGKQWDGNQEEGGAGSRESRVGMSREEDRDKERGGHGPGVRR